MNYKTSPVVAPIYSSAEIPTSRDLEPPGISSQDEEDEPPSRSSQPPRRFFGDVPDQDWNDWRWQFRHRITSITELAGYLPLSLTERLALEPVTKCYPLAITPYYLSLIDPADPDDPVRRQAVPVVAEIAQQAFGLPDPLGEEADSVMPGLVHRYPDRVLMVLTDVCPMLCRHCTRKREWRHGMWLRSRDEVSRMLDYIRSQPHVRDVILSGGDPLTLSNERLDSILSALRSVPNVEIIRIGSRMPVVMPQRIDAELCRILTAHGPIWFNTHFNHRQEVTPEAAAACRRLLCAGVPVNNQSVLLHGVNDSVTAQLNLSHALLKSSVRPYYLFHCDEVQGTEHLRTPIETGIQIIEGMRGHTSGLGVPTYVIDLPGGGGKVSLQPDYLLSNNGDTVTLRNYEGRVFDYRNPGNPQSGGAAMPTENLKNTGGGFVINAEGDLTMGAAKCASG